MWYLEHSIFPVRPIFWILFYASVSINLIGMLRGISSLRALNCLPTQLYEIDYIHCPRMQIGFQFLSATLALHHICNASNPYKYKSTS